jgi:hypothetical protein
LSEINKPAEGAPADVAEQLNNVKAEFQRKTSNLEESNKALAGQVQQLLAQLKGNPAENAVNAQKKVSVFDDEDAYADRVASEAEARIERKLQERARNQQVSAHLIAEYPELKDQSSALMKKADEIFKSLTPEDRAHPFAMKTAVYDAAADLDLKPMSKRVNAESDSFSMGADSGASRANRPNRSKSEFTPEDEQLANLLGIDLKDDKVAARIKGKHGRKTYGRYE